MPLALSDTRQRLLEAREWGEERIDLASVQLLSPPPDLRPDLGEDHAGSEIMFGIVMIILVIVTILLIVNLLVRCSY